MAWGRQRLQGGRCIRGLRGDTDIQKKIDHEIRMREGACKLLAACTQREQALEATKSLLVCNSRILAYMSELQRMKEPCASHLRIPLMWKDTEYFKNKGELHRCAVFCLLHLGVEIYDTEMVLVDRTLTDICFENAVTEAGPDFELRVELYSAALEEEAALGSAPKKLASKLSSSLGRSSGKRLRAALDGAPGSPLSNGGSSALGPKYHLLAHTVLSLADVQDGFRTHDLAVTCSEESSFWLPLYGSMCCRLAAQPRCMAAQVTCGFLRLQQAGEPQSWARLYCVLRGTNLLCYRRPQDAEGQEEPALTIAVNKETRIRAAEREPGGARHCVSVTNRYGADEVTHTLLAESRADVQRWMEAFWQHFYDMSQWKQCCEELMRIEVPSPRRPPAPLPKQGSLYHEMGERGHGVGHGDRDGARSVALLSALPLAPLRDAASLSASSCSLCHSGSAPLRLQRCPAPPGRPPPARGSCCRITPSRRRSALCSPPITVTGDVAGPPGCPHHGPRPLASATSRSRSVQAPPGSGNVPAAAPIPAVRRIPTLGMSQLQDMSRPGLDAAPGHILSPGLSPRERRPGQGGVPALELSWPRSG
uniref:Rhotekin n=1 Tax=Nothoprocta perdicaria TaxID=30464 RepID=A0A8C7E8D4_NOTPE